jgi:hypothetical protein
MRRIKRSNKNAHDFFMREECGPKKWAHYVIIDEGVSPFGHRTAHIIECINGAWLDYWAHTLYKSFDTTQLWCVTKIAERYAEAVKWQQEGKRITPWATSLIKGESKLAMKHNIDTPFCYCKSYKKGGRSCHIVVFGVSYILYKT